MWGRKRPKQTYDEMLAEGRATFADLIRMAEESHEAVGQTFGILDGMQRGIEELLGRGDGLPTKSVRAQLAVHERLWDEFLEETSAYEAQRRPWLDGGIETAEFAAMTPSLEYFAEYINTNVPVMERLNELIGDLGDLQVSLVELSAKIAPIRERVHAAMAAAATEIAWTGPAAQGKFALEVRLNTAADRLRELDAGLVEIDPDCSIVDWYRQVETEIADIRDAILRLTF
ncbi:hypothetical protein ACFY41_27995 [Streptomyces syringium]|uniref:hypothetical protein n=1 Tax=Streptomyces syringium TaxID=76729 RepID=UPI0036C1D8EC